MDENKINDAAETPVEPEPAAQEITQEEAPGSVADSVKEAADAVAAIGDVTVTAEKPAVKANILPVRLAFYIIGGLTLANIILFFLNLSSIYYPAGLMLQYGVDSLAKMLFLDGAVGGIIFFAATVLNVLLGLAYIALGVFVSPKRRALTLVGAAVYAADTVLVVLTLALEGAWLYTFDLVIHAALLALLITGVVWIWFGKPQAKTVEIPNEGESLNENTAEEAVMEAKAEDSEAVSSEVTEENHEDGGGI